MPEALAQMGFADMRKGQAEPISAAMGGRDQLVVLPTGAGKSAIFQLPTLAMRWKTLVFSPLVALMKDQVDGACRKGIRAACISSNQTDAENRSALQRWMAGDLQILYVAPERLNNEQFMHAIRMQPPNFVVLDEAHTLSQWSDNFRSSYYKIGHFVSEFNPDAVMCCTATCPPEVEADIRRVMAMPDAIKYVYYPRRSNLTLTSSPLESDFDVANLCKNVKGTYLVYCATIKQVEETAKTIQNYLGEDIVIYHGELPDETKRHNQDMFMNGTIRGVVATNAFGMGIDKPDIRMVVHRDHPGSLEALMQELGRAGRDGLPSMCMSYASASATRTQQFFIDSGYPQKSKIEHFYRTLVKCVDGDGKLMMTGSEMAERTNLQGRYVSSIIQILSGARVISRHEVNAKIGKVKFVGQWDDPKFTEYRDTINQGGERAANGYVEFDMNWLADRMGVKLPTVRTKINTYKKQGLIEFVPPFAGKATIFCGNLDQVDFERLKIKAAQAYKKLDEVLRYLSLPDSDKHAFLEEYFIGQEAHDL